MTTPVHEFPQPQYTSGMDAAPTSDVDENFVDESLDFNHLAPQPTNDLQKGPTREQQHRLNDDLAMLQAERVVSDAQDSQGPVSLSRSKSVHRSRSRRSARSNPVDTFDAATNPIHEKTALYKPPENPSSNIGKVFKRIHNSSFLIRYFSYIVPIVLILLIPLLLGVLLFKEATVGGVELLWFSVWLEIVWLTLWAGRIVAKMVPWPLGIVASLFTNNSKKWRDMGKQLEVPATIFFWALGLEISFLPTMVNHHLDGDKKTKSWENTMSRIIVSLLIGATLNFIEKIIIQLIAISFHLRTYADRIEVNKFQIGSLTKLYQYSKQKIAMDDSDFEQGGPSGPGSGARTPMQYLDKAQKNAREAFSKVGDVAGKVAGDFTGKKVTKSTHPHQVVLTLLNSPAGSQVLARRLWRTFVEDAETIVVDDLKDAFGNDDEAEAAFTMFDKDLNGDISLEELEAVCVEIGRERKSITASLKDLDSVVSKLDAVLVFVVIIVTLLVFISLISTSASSILGSAGSAVLALSWLFSATAQEFLQSVIFVLVKHPFDVGDRVSIYGNTGVALKGDDYFVKEISLLYTEFKKMEGHVVQAPNSYLNTLFILNMRRSGGLAEAVPLTIKFGTTLDQIDDLRARLLDFVKSENREYQGQILTEIRDIVEAHSVNLNVIFFYKSNWQNEALRLQRRNKFICAMMVSMQEIGIEGPRMRIPGQKEELPLYLQHAANGIIGNTDSSPGPHSGSLGREAAFVPNAADIPALRNLSSSLRHTTSTSRTSRARGESVSAMSKRVDFSLGMKDVGPGDMMGDVFDNRGEQRFPNFTRTSPSRSQVPQDRIAEEEEEDSNNATVGRSTSRAGANRSRFGLRRQSTESQTRLRRAPSGTHSNRFFGKHSHRFDGNGGYENLMEQGMVEIPESGASPERLDLRSGTISPQAILRGTESDSAGEVLPRPEPPVTGGLQTREEKGVGGQPSKSQTEDFEMREMKK